MPTSHTAPPQAPGRLGDPAMAPATDPRIHPRLLAALTPYGLDRLLPRTSVTPEHPPEVIARLCAASERQTEAFFEALPNDLPGDTDAVDHWTEVITGPDGDPLTLHLYRPRASRGPLPAVIYLHGGGMTILRTDNKVHRRWCEDLAGTGMVVVAVDFRNACQGGTFHPWPAGLDDCATALAWVDDHRDDLGIHRVILQGESGGGNLVLATALKAKRDGRMAAIDGVYASVPYISGGYGWDDERKAAELPSLLENDDYFIGSSAMTVFASVYDPGRERATDPLVWPYFATEEDLAGLPPHVISVDELDPLRDEGIAYERSLARAGVPVVGRMNLGLLHAADSIFRQALPDTYWATVADISRFAGAAPTT